jgi:CheY-like chemotaxis protein/AraC-like DNA-binding protein
MELTDHKIDFLTNISNELKTPLSMIIGPLSKMIDLVKTSEVKDQLSDVRQNALKMSSLIHQMMEASRQEVDGFGLIVTKTDLVVFVQSIVSVFDKPLRDKQITISLESNVTSLLMDADVLKLEVILNNILSNAAKFAPENSQILVKIEGTENQVLMAVTDQGPGIDAHDLPHVFERFYQSHRSLPQNKEGSGIGLSIVKEYVQMHNGSVKAVTDGKSGTTIEIVLPVQQASVDTAQPFAKATKPIFKENSKKPVVLVVEDNLEILNFIANNLANQYKCITAQNGKIGFEMALVEQPDIIITDVMMPVMDGLEMCRRLKENITTSLIPVIVLTAKDDRDTELKGYQIGIDVFIAKPFEISYLSERIRNLLKGRNLLVQKARQEAIIQPKEEEIVSPDEKFLTIITQIIEAEMANPDLNVNVLSERSGYSAKQVYRRIKSLTGQTAVDYIRSVRLKKAAMLLSGKTFTVAEVMYMVGFSNHSYFAKRFQEMFGKSPKQFAEDGLKGL